MKKMTVENLETTSGGGGKRMCFINGLLTVAGVGIGFAIGGFLGGAAASIGGLMSANSDGCF